MTDIKIHLTWAVATTIIMALLVFFGFRSCERTKSLVEECIKQGKHPLECRQLNF